MARANPDPDSAMELPQAESPGCLQTYLVGIRVGVNRIDQPADRELLPGRRPAGRLVMTSVRLGSTPGIRRMLRTSLNLWVASRPIPGGSLTCMAMPGSWCRIAGITTITKHQPMAVPGKQTN